MFACSLSSLKGTTDDAIISFCGHNNVHSKIRQLFITTHFAMVYLLVLQINSPSPSNNAKSTINKDKTRQVKEVYSVRDYWST
jgi:hypothetical protein